MEHKVYTTIETPEEYWRYIDERLQDEALMESQLYTLMMLTSDGKEALSSPISLKSMLRHKSLGNKTLSIFNMLSEDFIPVQKVNGSIANGNWKADPVLDFPHTVEGLVRDGYLMPYQDRDKNDPSLRDIADIDQLMLV